ncbi:hypothetical protein [Clostridium magnum]|uniref:Uncharacterized protein n=1 Tax=Clostridium magnum DSM 2767 TaxID=1121326 RepID=A0A162QQ43_9CLOT|nr:hypothetical protein [Clostridium magnum]KZL88814.1 hypothetical protein CLMAG_59070 [Clostridium magnum DSM 2767]SHI77790.1 hypothetical protein SAMN02745944_04829 [Clostridium magnum DSM 2767]
MEKEKIINFLLNNDLEEVQEINNDGEVLVLRFYYDFDEDELSAARAYASDESEDEEEGDSWYDEFLLPYLNELAVDSTGEIIEELMEELSVEAQYMSYEIDRENYDYNEFIAVFYEKGKSIDLDEVLKKIDE